MRTFLAVLLTCSLTVFASGDRSTNRRTLSGSYALSRCPILFPEPEFHTTETTAGNQRLAAAEPSFLHRLMVKEQPCAGRTHHAHRKFMFAILRIAVSLSSWPAANQSEHWHRVPPVNQRNASLVWPKPNQIKRTPNNLILNHSTIQPIQRNPQATIFSVGSNCYTQRWLLRLFGRGTSR